jgi:hypothetical protein
MVYILHVVREGGDNNILDCHYDGGTCGIFIKGAYKLQKEE